jgi:hypothetical protein
VITTTAIVVAALCRTGWLRLRHLSYAASLVVALCCGCSTPPITDSFKSADLGPSSKNQTEQVWSGDAPRHLTSERVSGGIMP